MKIIITILCLVFFSVSSLAQIEEDKYSAYLKTLNLSNKQKEKIELINQKYLLKLTELNANVLVQKMSVAQIRSQSQYNTEYQKLNSKLRLMQNELDELEKQKQEEISSVLGFIQRIKYKRFCRLAKSEGV